MNIYTDYPIEELGDAPRKPAPIRECQVLSYDGNKYCKVLISGVEKEIKSGYLYTKPGRIGEVPQITKEYLKRFQMTSIEVDLDKVNKYENVFSHIRVTKSSNKYSICLVTDPEDLFPFHFWNGEKEVEALFVVRELCLKLARISDIPKSWLEIQIAMGRWIKTTPLGSISIESGWFSEYT